MSGAGGVLDEPRLRALLAAVPFVTRLIVLESCESTNDALRRQIADGAEEGTVVVADRQRAGRGRMGRSWESRPGLGLYLSALMRPQDELRRVTRWTLAAAVAACDACRAVSGGPVDIKWPNDLYADGRKVAGILAELRSAGSRADLVLGMGINVRHRPEDFSPDLRDRATSLWAIRAAAADERQGLDRETLAALFLESLAVQVRRLHAGDWAGVAEDWLARAPAARDSAVRVLPQADRSRGWVGTTRGIDEDGALRVERPDGAVEAIRTADSVVELSSEGAR